MFTRHEKYRDENKELTERKIRSMTLRAMRERMKIDLKSAVNLLGEKKMSRPST